jgi:GAF domain-containing protein
VSRLGRILPILLANQGEGSLVGAVCLSAVTAIGVDGAGLSLLTSEHRGPVCAHGGFAALGEDLQLSLGEGPWVDAFEAIELIEVTNLASHEGTRWPIFSEQMADAGVGSLASFPLRIGGARFGALTLYRSAFGALSTDQVADSYVIAQLTAHLIVAEQARIRGDLVISDIESGFARMEQIHQATGMIMAQASVGAEDALARLRGAAFAAQRSVLDMATVIVAGKVVLPRDD